MVPDESTDRNGQNVAGACFGQRHRARNVQPHRTQFQVRRGCKEKIDRQLEDIGHFIPPHYSPYYYRKSLNFTSFSLRENSKKPAGFAGRSFSFEIIFVN